MKAAIYTKFGPPEVLQIVDVDKPVPKDDEVLVRIHATTVEIEDPGFRKSPGFNGLLKPRNPILGMELAGEVESVGVNVTLFKPGDQVYGNAGMRFGTYAEYICLPESGALAIKPSNDSYAEAAAITNGALTALPFLRDKGDIREGQRILINGASGTVGSAAVQLAKYYGTEVSGVCSTPNLDKVQSLGADRVIDYTLQNIEDLRETYDILFDVAGKTTFNRSKHLVKEGGIFLSTVPTPAILLQALWTSRFGNKRVRTLAAGMRSPEDKASDLVALKDIIETGALKPVIDRSYPLEEIVEAHRYVEGGNKKGTVVITISHAN